MLCTALICCAHEFLVQGDFNLRNVGYSKNWKPDCVKGQWTAIYTLLGEFKTDFFYLDTSHLGWEALESEEQVAHFSWTATNFLFNIPPVLLLKERTWDTLSNRMNILNKMNCSISLRLWKPTILFIYSACLNSIHISWQNYYTIWSSPAGLDYHQGLEEISWAVWITSSRKGATVLWNSIDVSHFSFSNPHLTNWKNLLKDWQIQRNFSIDGRHSLLIYV